MNLPLYEARSKLERYVLKLDCDKKIIDDIFRRAETARVEELNLDSQDFLMLAFLIEEDFDIVLELENIANKTTIMELLEYIDSLIREN